MTNNEQIKRAIGIKYNAGEGQEYDKSKAPTVVSKGVGELAETIIQQAQEAGVLIHEDPALSNFLAQLELGQEIPDTLYQLIAELIAYSYYLQGITPSGWPERQA